MPVKIEYKSSVLRDLKKLQTSCRSLNVRTKFAVANFVDIDRKAAERILDKIEAVLSNNPNIGEPLKGDFKGLFRYRVGDYRIIYVKTPESILILRIGHRSSVYK